MLIKHLKDMEFNVFGIKPTVEGKWVSVYGELSNIGQLIIKPLIKPHTLYQIHRFF
jgi:hypothetical protein